MANQEATEQPVSQERLELQDLLEGLDRMVKLVPEEYQVRLELQGYLEMLEPLETQVGHITKII